MHVRNWRRLRRRTLALLAVWFVAGPLLGILLAERVNALSIAGAPLGFWIAQQGAIYVFVILIFLNAWLADRAEGGAAPATPPPSPASGGSTLAPDAPAAPAP
ncbi:MAG: sodium/substrate symporter small subunit, partial [Longimicrobiales bacterium]